MNTNEPTTDAPPAFDNSDGTHVAAPLPALVAGERCTEDILSGLRDRRIAIVGNATPQNQLGNLIDQYDVVIRLNNFRLAGFEDWVGRKTDFRCTSGWKDVEHRNEHLEFSPFSGGVPESFNVANYNALNARPLLTARTDIHQLIPTILKPSTGCALVELCAHLGLHIDLFCFDGFKTPHYWEPGSHVHTTHATDELSQMLRHPNVRLVSGPFISPAAPLSDPAGLYCLPPGYQARLAPEYYGDHVSSVTGVTWQPDVYPIAACLARQLGCFHLLDLGCGQAEKLAGLHPEFMVTGVDYGANIRHCRERYGFGQWLETNFESIDRLAIPDGILARSVVICSDVIEHLVEPRSLLRLIRNLLEHAPVAVLSTPERDRARGPGHMGPPTNPAHVREWNLAELEALLAAEGLRVDFIGLTRSNTKTNATSTQIVVVVDPRHSGELIKDARRGDAIGVVGPRIVVVPTTPMVPSTPENRGNDASLEREQAVLPAPGDADSLVRRGDLQAGQGEIEEARKSYAQALMVTPGHEAATEQLINLTVACEKAPAVSARVPTPGHIPALSGKATQSVLPAAAGLAPDSKEAHELAYWTKRKEEEKTLANTHYRRFYTAHFGLPYEFYAGKRLLDIGCGPRGSLEWADNSLERVGLDPLADNYVELGSATHKMRYVASGSESIPFPDDHFDVVTSFNSLDHVADLSRTIQEIIRVVKPGGLFLLLTDVNHSPTPCEPIEFSWDVVEHFKTAFEVLEERHFENSPKAGLYRSVEEGTPYNHGKPGRRKGILSLKFRKRVVAPSMAQKAPVALVSRDGLNRNQEAFPHLQSAFDLLQQRKFVEAQAECRLYHQQVDYDSLERTDHRQEADPRVSVVIVAYKIGRGLIQCLDSLAASPSPRHEVIVVDNGGNEEIAAELAGRPILHIRMPMNVILSEGRNVGLHFARGPIASFVDDDAIVAPGYLNSVVAAFEAFEICAFRGKVLPKSDHANNSKARHYNLGDLAIPADVDTEGNSAFLVEVYRELGGMDPLLFGMEGTDLSYRIAQKRGDYVNIYWPDAVIYHDYANTDDKLGTKHKRHLLMRDYALFKHPGLYQRHNQIVAFNQSDSARRTGHGLILRRGKQRPSERQAPVLSGQPFISICIPTFNRADLLGAAVSSALEQSYSHCEIVVVDDGSTDGTPAVMEKLISEKVRYVRKEHSGGPATRNRCVAEARGEFIVWLDSDDLIMPRTLEIYALELERRPYLDVLYGDLRVVDRNLEGNGLWAYRDYMGWPEVLLSDLVTENRVPNVCTLVRKACYARVGGYDEAFPRAHDYEFWTRLALEGVFARVNQVVGVYRQHAQSLSRHNQQTDTSYEARVVKALVDRHGLRRLLPYCFAEGVAVASGEAHAWHILALLLLKYGDLTAARDYLGRSLAAGSLPRAMKLQRLLDTIFAPASAAKAGNGSRPVASSPPRNEFEKLVETAMRGLRLGRDGDGIRACARLSELCPEAIETLALTGFSLMRWGDRAMGRTAFKCLVERQTEAASSEAADVGLATARLSEESVPAEAQLSHGDLTSLLRRVLAVEAIPGDAIAQTLAFLGRLAEAPQPRRFVAQHREGLTPLLFALVGLDHSVLQGNGGKELERQVQSARAGLLLEPSVASASEAPGLPGYSFCIITNGQRPEKLRRQIESIRALQIPHFEILVGGGVPAHVDGAVVVPMPEAARDGRLSQMRNTLARQARFDHLVVSDDDMIFHPDFFTGLKRYGEDYEAMAVRMLNPDGSRFWDWATVGGSRGQVLLEYWENDPNVYITGGLCVLKKSVFDQVAWDENRGFYGGEDVDFSRRLQAAGISIRFNPHALVTHDDDRYTRVDRKVMRFDHILQTAERRYQCGELEAARKLMAVAVRLGQGNAGRLQEVFNVARKAGEADWLRSSECPAPPAGAPANDSKCGAGSHQPGRLRIAWEGSFLDLGSLSHVNRELSRELAEQTGWQLKRVGKNTLPKELARMPAMKQLARELQATPARGTEVTVRHAWPPNWTLPREGAWVLIQPWEYGSLPAAWVEQIKQVDEVWAPSEYVRRVYVESGVPDAKVHVVPNGVNPALFHPQAKPMRLATGKTFKFLFVGGTIFRKGPEILLKAYLEQFTAADDVCLVIKDFGGSNVYAGQTFEAEIRAAQSQPNHPEILYLVDDIAEADMAGLYTAADCLVHPYRGEGFGLPVLEAMACGLPVVVTGGGATDDFATDEFAYRIPARRRPIGQSVGGMALTGEGWVLEPDAAAFGARIKWIFTHPDEARAKGRAAGEHVHRQWTWKRASQIARQRLQALVAARQSATASAPAPRKVARTLELPATARVGHLKEATALFQQKAFLPAWNAALAAIEARPFHPEAFLLLGQIARAAGDIAQARHCAGRASQLAPQWKPAKKFLHSLPNKASASATTWPQPSGSSRLVDTGEGLRISVCLITRNEEKFLDQALVSVRDLVHQIVVVDTGSTDGTLAIAKKHGAEIYHADWADDFSAARNVSLEHATGDWILVLDADEELLAEGRARLLEEMRDPAVLAYRLPMIDQGRESEGRSFVPRLFRNAPGLFYVGRVHEQVFSSIEVRRKEWGLENKLGTAVLLHHGYVAAVVKDRKKIERNLRLLERAVEEMPDEPNLLMNLGLELVRSNRPREGLDRYLEAFRVMSAQPREQLVPELRETLLSHLCTQLMNAKNYSEVVRTLESPLARGSLTASHHFAFGLALMELKRFGEAATQLKHCVAKRHQPSLSPINPEIQKAGPNHCLALALAEAGQSAEAEEAFRQAESDDPASRRVAFDRARFLNERTRPLEALKILQRLVAEQADDAAAWQLGGTIALSRPEFLEFADDWTGEAIKHLPQDAVLVGQRAQTLLLSGRPAESLSLWRQLQPAAHPQTIAALALCETIAPDGKRLVNRPQVLAVSQEFVRWYQRLIKANAAEVIHTVNGRLEELRCVVPEAVTTLQAALTEAGAVPRAA